ncbi:unnamed protein product [Closterium sp. Naga37s-1]|nr:unnamed protein product [Closterium sp. Naga37s-1]
MFFHKFVPFRRLVNAKKGGDLFTFGEFAWLLRLMREQRQARMDSHVQPSPAAPPSPTPPLSPSPPPFTHQMFFRKFIPFRRLVNAKKGNDLFSFGEFAWLLRLMREQRRGRMESHVQPQIDACRFDKIRFDFVGRFENLAEDVGAVLRRLNRTVGESYRAVGELGALKSSKDAHPTNAGSKLLELYDEVSGTMVVGAMMVEPGVGVGECVLRRLNRTVGESGAFKISKDAHPTNAGSKLLELYDKVSVSVAWSCE